MPHRRDLIREYLTYCRVEKGLAGNSIESYQTDLARLSGWSAKNELDLEKLTRQDLREWLMDLAAEKLIVLAVFEQLPPRAVRTRASPDP